MQKFELTAPNAFVPRATVVDDPVRVEAWLQELHPDLKSILFKDAIRCNGSHLKPAMLAFDAVFGSQ